MSHSVEITLISDAEIEIFGDLVRVDELKSIELDESGQVSGYSCVGRRVTKIKGQGAYVQMEFVKAPEGIEARIRGKITETLICPKVLYLGREERDELLEMYEPGANRGVCITVPRGLPVIRVDQDSYLEVG